MNIFIHENFPISGIIGWVGGGEEWVVGGGLYLLLGLGLNYLSHDFTESVKLALEKQTS